MKHLLLTAGMFAVFFVACGQTPIQLIPGFTNEVSLAKNQKTDYSIQLKKNDFLEINIMQKGVDVVIDLYSTSANKLKSFDTPNGATGSEHIEWVAGETGTYRLEVRPYADPAGMTDSALKKMLETNPGHYSITSVKIMTGKEYQQKLKTDKENRDQVIQWMSTNALPLKTVMAGNGFEDLQPLKKILADVTVVGLGEATHGTREFFQMKHRMLEFLVKEMGFTVFAIEGAYTGSLHINDYVLYGKGDAHTALASQGFWTWDTQEMIAMIEWMRSYNTTVPANKKVKFLGFDIQSNDIGGGIATIKTYLQKVDTIRYRGFKFTGLENSRSGGKDSMIRSYNDFLSFFVRSKGNYIQRSSEAEYDSVLACCRILGQYFDAFLLSPENPRWKEHDWRDYYMAGNFFDLASREIPGTKFVVWAHNGHVSFNPVGFVNVGLHPLGSYLKEAYGSKYYAFGFAFNKGGFQSIEFDSTGKSMGLQEFIVSLAKNYSLDWCLAQTKQPLFMLNLRAGAEAVPVNSFLHETQDMRSVGAAAIRKDAETYFARVAPANEFDGLIFFNETHRSQPTPTGMRKAN